MAALVASPDQITVAWIQSALEGSGYLVSGRVTDVELGEVQDARSVVVPLKVTYSNAVVSEIPSRFILKIPPLNDRALDVEVAFYRDIAPQMNDPAPIRCYFAAFDPDQGLGNFLLEDLSVSHYSHPPSQLPIRLHHAEAIVDIFARMHGFWWGSDQLRSIPCGYPTPDSIRRSTQWREETFPKFVDFLGDRLSDERRQIYEKVMPHLERLLMDRFADASTLTLVHNDPHAGNFLYPHDPVSSDVRILDWKSLEVTYGTDVLAHMMAVFWFPERRTRFEQTLLRRYHEALQSHGVVGYSGDDLWYDYRLSVLSFLFYPMSHWFYDGPIDVWWHILERVMLAYDDLNCSELI